MKTYLTSAIAALAVSAGFAGAAMAQNAVYPDPNGLPQSPPTIQQDRGYDRGPAVDTMPTGSIYPSTGYMTRGASGNADLDGAQDEGDYYDGTLRPHN
ncbi:hypothetical protein J2T08_001276 [Neorhizobium galegae]|uniref:hypothetical protein n=1 Tax=Neorhizobium galegae TaxID=399 RepID=UPI001AEB8062|nr:hypothetical protein [Neorhizobium galegae]MBP2560601.1 hypothetical protein [Neorhizobium galegae]MDQ0133375.1 hypothetical protein [Neorhizobium galegae]